MILSTDRLILRRWKESDKKAFRDINADPEVMEFYPKPCSAEESDQIVDRIEEHFRRHGYGLFATVHKESSDLLGFETCQMNEIVAMTATINLKSRRVMEKLSMTYDPRDDFEVPKIEEGHRLRPHVLYRLKSNVLV